MLEKSPYLPIKPSVRATGNVRTVIIVASSDGSYARADRPIPFDITAADIGH